MAQLKRLVSMLGLAGVGWIAYTLVSGQVSLVDAGMRSAAVLGVVVGLSWMLGAGVRLLASALDRV